MKKIVGLIIVVLAFTSCQQQKTGYVDNGKIINEIKEKIELETKYTNLDAEFKKKGDSLGQLFQAEYAKINSYTGSKKEKEMQVFNQKAQAFQQQMQNDQQSYQKKYQVEIDSLIVKVKTFVSDYGKSNGYDYIFGTVETSPSIMFAKEENDLSQKIIEGLNTAFNK